MLLRLLKKTLLIFLLTTTSSVLALRWLSPPTSAFMLRAQWDALVEGNEDFRLNHRWTERKEISRWAAMAIVAAEDQRFLYHWGFDFNAISKAVRRNQHARTMHGASTLSQQTAKNLFLYSNRSLLRKALEAYFTLLLEICWPKHRILEMYLNIAQFGDGIYGVETASQRYFHKSSKQLKPGEAALLAAVLPNPIKLRADKPSAYVLKRRDWILRQMRVLQGSEYLRGI